MKKVMSYVQDLNDQFDLSLTGVSPIFGHRAFGMPRDAKKIVVKDFGNGLGRVIYTDSQNRLIANNMEKL